MLSFYPTAIYRVSLEDVWNLVIWPCDFILIALRIIGNESVKRTYIQMWNWHRFTPHSLSKCLKSRAFKVWHLALIVLCERDIVGNDSAENRIIRLRSDYFTRLSFIINMVCHAIVVSFVATRMTASHYHYNIIITRQNFYVVNIQVRSAVSLYGTSILKNTTHGFRGWWM